MPHPLSSTEIIGLRIQSLRRKKGLTGADLAVLLQISQQHVSRIEHGAVRLTAGHLYRIAQCLETDVGELLSGIGYQDSGFSQCSGSLQDYIQAELIADKLLYPLRGGQRYGY